MDDVAGRIVQVGQALHNLRGDGLCLLLGQHLRRTATAAALLHFTNYGKINTMRNTTQEKS